MILQLQLQTFALEHPCASDYPIKHSDCELPLPARARAFVLSWPLGEFCMTPYSSMVKPGTFLAILRAPDVSMHAITSLTHSRGVGDHVHPGLPAQQR